MTARSESTLLKSPVKAAGLTADGLGKAIDEHLVSEKIFTHPRAVVSLPVQSRGRVYFSADLACARAPPSNGRQTLP